MFQKNSWKNSKLKQNLEKTQAKIPKKLKNQQLQLNWIGGKLSKKKPDLRSHKKVEMAMAQKIPIFIPISVFFLQ